MLDGILGRGFTAKCKSLTKLTKSRIDVIRRKRRATEKFLKKDIADLLLNGLDINAYGRAEGLVVELTLSSCYSFIEQCCEFVLKHLPTMQKLSRCPEECRMAVSSLMFGAARFSDLPELRDLRQIFQERYGNSMECYVNQEFAANLNLKSSTLENKVCLMQEIASEFSINWDSKAFIVRMSRSSANLQDHNDCTSNNDKPSHGTDFTQKEVMDDVLFEKKYDLSNNECRFRNSKEAVVLNRLDHDLHSKSTLPGNRFKPLNGHEVPRERNGNDNPGRQEITVENSDIGYWKEGSMLKPIGHPSVEQFEGGPKLQYSTRDISPLRANQGSMLKSIRHRSHQKTVEQFKVGSKLQEDSWRNSTPLRENQDTATARKSPSHAGSRHKSNANELHAVNHVSLPGTDKSERENQRDEKPTPNPCFSNLTLPPYLKHPNSKQQSSNIRGANIKSSLTDSGGISTYYSAHEKPDAASVTERIQIHLDSSDQDWQGNRHERLRKQSREKETSIAEDTEEVHVIKPRSMRRRHSRSRPPGYYDASGLERKSRSRNRRPDGSRRGLKAMLDDERYQNAEEEMIIDKLLIHYSKKPPVLVPERLKRNSKTHHAHDSTRELLQNGSGSGSDETPEMVSHHASRSFSLPREQHRETEIKKKVFARAATFAPVRSQKAPHVHPKLPDCDDLAARIAALIG